MSENYEAVRGNPQFDTDEHEAWNIIDHKHGRMTRYFNEEWTRMVVDALNTGQAEPQNYVWEEME